MSLATFRGEGEGAIERYQYRNRHCRPYLQRNVRQVLQYLTMGSKFSSLSASPGPKTLVPADDGDEEDIRPAKRRKTSTVANANNAFPHESESPRRKPFGHVTNESKRASSRLVGKLQAVQPSDFYRISSPAPPSHLARSATKGGVLGSKGSKTAIQNFLPDDPIDFKRALRIEVLGIIPKFSNADETLEFNKGRKSPIESECRCSIALFCAKIDDDPSRPIRPQDYNEVQRASKVCTLRTTFNKGQVSRELILEPFILSPDEFYVTRKRPTRLRPDNYAWVFGDKYYVQVSLEARGLQDEWPPLDISTISDANAMDEGSLESSPVTDLLRLGKIGNNDLFLFSSMPGLLDPDRQVRSVDLKLCHGAVKQKVPYELQVEIQWSLPNQYCDTPINGPPIESPQRIISTAFSEAVPISPLGAKVHQPSSPDSMAERASRRRSNVPTYNLKTLSAQAQGKSPRTRKTLKPRSFQEGTDASGGIVVTYNFGRAGAAELGIRPQTSVPGLMCPFCCRDQTSIDHLRLHLHTNHTNFKFSLRRSNLPRVGFYVELAKPGPRSSPAERTKTLQLGHPPSLFDLDKFLNGDQSWVKAREGPQHNHWPEHLSDRFHESSLSSSPRESRHSSPNTSNDTDELMDLDNYLPKKPVRRKIFYVPKTSKPLYDTITKRILVPGEEIPDSDDEKDETWLHQKHRDIIMDFTDVTDEEKDYIIRWNPFIVEAHLTCEKYLPDACLRFAKANAAWFAERPSRKVEFGKHMETFVMRGIVEQECLEKCVEVLRAAERRRAEKGNVEGKTQERLASPPRLRGVLDCVCCEHIQAPDRVICRGLVSIYYCLSADVC